MHLHYSTLFMLTPTTNSSRKELGELVIFQPVLQAFPTCHSWIITAHVSLDYWNTTRKLLIGNLPGCGNYYILWTSNHQSKLNYYQHYKWNFEILKTYTTIISAIKLLQSNPSFDGQSQTHIHHMRSLLPFLGDALSWLTGTATTKDIKSIKTWINQLIATQLSQETLVHNQY